MISESILNLNKQGLITAPEDDPHVSSELRQQGAPLLASDVDPIETTPPESKSNSRWGWCVVDRDVANVLQNLLFYSALLLEQSYYSH